MIPESEKANADSSEVVDSTSEQLADIDETKTVEQPEPAQTEESDRFTLSRSDQAVAIALAAIVIVLMALQWARLSGWGVEPIEIGELPPIANDFRLDINDATAIEWSQLDGIGEVLADRIVQDRTLNGRFESIEDLSRVDGIGPQTLERIRQWLTVKQID
ncbi:MAG: ComEA family DNA-binding protein [Planctomycetaceae bacterium]